MKNKIILNIGTLPPPVGGVTIHLKRLLEYLQKTDLQKTVVLYDYKKESYFSGLKKIWKANCFHLHLSNKWARFVMVLIAIILRKKVIITFHGKYNFKNYLDKWVIRRADMSCVLNEFTYAEARIIVKDERKLKLVSAFIPPLGNEGTLSEETKKRTITFKRQFNEVFCTNAHHFVLDEDGRDLYGIDLILMCMTEMPQKGLIILDPSGDLYEKYQKFSKFENILFISRPEPFVEIIKLSEGFIRATTTDGDSLSVKESLYYGIPVIASDCVDRPRSCVLFAVNDKEDLKKKLARKNEMVDMGSVENGALSIVNIYRSL